MIFLVFEYTSQDFAPAQLNFALLRNGERVTFKNYVWNQPLHYLFTGSLLQEYFFLLKCVCVLCFSLIIGISKK